MPQLSLRPIGRKTWYQLALMLPLLLPAVLWGTNRLYPFPGLLAALYVYLFSAAFFGGAQYAVFVCAVIWWGRNRTAIQFHDASWLWPVLFVPLCALGAPFVLKFEGGSSGHYLDNVSVGFSMALFALPVGYFYICIVHGLTRLLQQIGWVIEN